MVCEQRRVKHEGMPVVRYEVRVLDMNDEPGKRSVPEKQRSAIRTTQTCRGGGGSEGKTEEHLE